MKKHLYIALGAVTTIMVIVGCAVSSTTSLAQKNKNIPQDMAGMNDNLESEDSSRFEEEITEQKAEIIFNEWGYTYSKTGNGDSSIKECDSGDIVNSELGYEGEAEDKPEVILQWSDAQESLDDDKLCWLNNEYLCSYADDISFIISDSDIVTAKYVMQTSKANVRLFTVAEDDSEYFEFSCNYTSEIYNIHQIQGKDTWQCFSYHGYNGIEYTSAVLANKNTICEITFENCDEQFICNTLAAY